MGIKWQGGEWEIRKGLIVVCMCACVRVLIETFGALAGASGTLVHHLKRSSSCSFRRVSLQFSAGKRATRHKHVERLRGREDSKVSGTLGQVRTSLRHLLILGYYVFFEYSIVFLWVRTT